MFIDFLSQGRSTRRYAETHLAYLKDEIGQSEKDLAQRTAQPGLEDSLRQCQTHLNMLLRELSRIPAAIDDRTALADARSRITRIRKDLEKAALRL
jgi:hypothetical protein